MPNTLEHSPARILAWLLIQLGLGTDPDDDGLWPVFYSREPDRPDNCITVYTTRGTDDGRTMIDGKIQNHEGFQVRVRGSTDEVAYRKIDAIQTTLAQASTYQETVHVYGDGEDTGLQSSYSVHAITRIGDPLFIGSDTPTSKRVVYTLNATTVIDQLS